uniref:Uncharacterized protein n=1 Tax=Musca domestica TaxID=7370 RepID=A0A1I8NL14_MUSDO
MHYLTALRAGVEPTIVARDFIQEFVFSYISSGEISLELICNFINDTLLAIGIPGQITPEQIDYGPNSYQWPTEVLQIYSFHCNNFEFASVEMFLLAICKETHEQTEQFLNKVDCDDGDELSDLETPIELLTQLMGGWRSAYKQLLMGNNWGTAQKFKEPLARINVCLLEGMHKLRMSYRTALSILDRICKILFDSALQGLCYKQSSGPIIDRILILISKDLEIFKDSLADFFYEILSLEYTPGILKMYHGLNIMLEENEDHRLKILTDILIERKFLDVYYTTLRQEGTDVAKMQLETLKFLKILQSKLITLDCFSRDFMEAILNLVLQNKKKISHVACSLYVAMMKRKMTDDFIFKHILKFFMKYMTSRYQLMDYVKHFYNNFEYFQCVHNFFNIIVNAKNADDLRLLSSHVVLLIIEMNFETNESPTIELEPIVQLIPEIFEKIDLEKCYGILLGIFNYIDMQMLQGETLDHITYYAEHIFKNLDKHYEYALLMNVFSVFHKCLIVTQEWQHLELISDELMFKYYGMIRKLEMKQDKKRRKLPFDFYANFLEILKRINIIIKTRYETFDNLEDVIRSLQENVLDSNRKEFQEKNIDIFAIEICVSSLIHEAKKESTTSILDSTCFGKAQGLSKYLINCLKNINEPTKLPAFRLKAYFCSLLNLYCHFPITLTTNFYCYLAEILSGLHGLSKHDYSQLSDDDHPYLAFEYHRIMFEHFAELHKYQHIEVKSHIVWKLCIHYGEPHNKFNEELKGLLKILATSRMNVYTHIIAVIVYNLYKQQPPMNNNTILIKTISAVVFLHH